MTTYNAFLIDPAARSISAITVDHTDQLAQLYKHIGCELVEALDRLNGDTAWFDEEGLHKPGQQFFFLPDVYPHPLAGRCVITGTTWDETGDNLADPKSTAEELAAAVEWVSAAVIASAA